MNLTNAQNKAVNELVSIYKGGKIKKVNFKAPTGSGKTFMAANFISDILFNSKKTMVIVATVSNAELPFAFANKLEMYKPFLNNKNFTVEYCASPSNSEAKKTENVSNPFMLVENKVLVFGVSSFGKNRIWSERGYLDNFLIEAKEKDWNIVFIRDEAHKQNTREDSKNFDKKMNENASFILQMTATPKNFDHLVEISEEELEEDDMHLLKQQMKYGNITDADEDITVLEDAIEQFKTIKKDYQELKEDIRPAMLIQVDDKKSSDKVKAKLFDDTLKI